jgi:hypothetical protein
MQVLYHSSTGFFCDVSAIRGEFSVCGSELGKVKSLTTESTEVHRGTPPSRIPLWIYSVELCALCGYAFLL